jgi:hypothetical protein
VKLWQYQVLILGSIWIMIALFTGWLAGGVIGATLFIIFNHFVKGYYYHRHPEEAKRVRDKNLKKAGVKTEKEYQVQMQKKQSKAFHSVLMLVGALFLSIIVAAVFNNLYLFWIILVVCIFLIAIRNKVRILLET